MKRFIAMLFALLLALNLCACDVNAPTTDPTETTVVTTPTDTTGTTDVTEPADTTGPTTDTTEPILQDPYDMEELEELLGISISMSHTNTALDVEIIWTNKAGFEQQFGYRYTFYALQNNTRLTMEESSDNVNDMVKPGETITIHLQFALNDTSPVTLELRDDPNTPGLLWTFTYDLSAVG